MRVKKDFIKKMNYKNFEIFLNYDFNLRLKDKYFKNEESSIEMLKEKNFKIAVYYSIINAFAYIEEPELKIKELHQIYKKMKKSFKKSKSLKFSDIIILEETQNYIDSSFDNEIYSDIDRKYFAFLQTITMKLNLKARF